MLRGCRNCGWIGGRLAYDPLEMAERACPNCRHSFDWIFKLPTRTARLFDWRVAYARYRGLCLHRKP